MRQADRARFEIVDDVDQHPLPFDSFPRTTNGRASFHARRDRVEVSASRWWTGKVRC